MQNFQNLILSFFVSLFSAIALGLFEPHITLLALIGFGIFIFCLFQFYIKLGSDIPLKELIMIIAFLQWIVGPILSYHFYTRSEFYYMIIDENTYMSYTLPASAAFFLGIFAPVFRRKYDDEDVKIEEISLGEQKRYRKKGGFLFTAGAL
ncbi:MAG: hypothetical protein IT235_03690, partial [Bacteroidia bacterium]|nr:hypothetical protein [Bacteroidia bacterium]